jgi:hypothetical protein
MVIAGAKGSAPMTAIAAGLQPFPEDIPHEPTQITIAGLLQ